MKRWLPSPWLSAGLFMLWQMLHQPPSAAHVLLGAVLGLAAPVLAAPLRPAPGPLRHIRTLLALVLRVGVDVVVSAIVVATGVLRARRRPPRERFVRVPLELRDEHALAALSMILSVIPGTVWTELAPDRSVLLVHVFDAPDEALFIEDFKRRYERPLREIFE